MSIPTSLIVVLLVVAWLVVLVPMIAKRRDKVPHAQSGGNGFRVLRRAQASLRRRPRRGAKSDAEVSAEPAPTDPTTVETTAADPERTLVRVGAPDESEPLDAAEEWAAAHTGYQSVPAPARPDEFETHDENDGPGRWDQPGSVDERRAYDAPSQDLDYRSDIDHAGEDQDARRPEQAVPSVTEFPRADTPRIPNEIDEQEWVEHAAAAGPMYRHDVDDEALRPTPRRRGRGGYDPEAAEATRAYRYRQRRRVTLVLAAATVLFSVIAFLLAGWLWVGAAISLTLLVLYLAYLRRQVKIEAQIRQRRMERLQRARQIRPEYGRGRPPARAGRSAVAPGRTLVDMDDDDPSFDHLEPYDPPMTYRRAAGQ